MKYLKWIFIATLFINISCENYLDIDRDNEITEKDMFSTSYGFRTAINGLYINMADKDLYGKELSFALVDVMSRQYDINKDNMFDDLYVDIYNGETETKEVTNKIEDIWIKSYNIIANANNIINKVKDKPNEFFKYGEKEKNMIHGEALACRALIHFDILRLFAPAPISSDNGNYIPYVDTYPNIRPIEISAKECLGKIKDDLKEAHALLASFDTTDMGICASADKEARFYNTYNTGSILKGNDGEALDLFFKNRGFRLSYNAVTALLARVCQYNGDYEDALEYSEDIINKTYDFDDYKGEFYEFSHSGYEHYEEEDWSGIIEEWNEKENLRMLDEVIFACYNDYLYEFGYGVYKYFRKTLSSVSENSKSTITSNPSYFCPELEKHQIFMDSENNDESEDDIRYKHLIFKADFGAYPISGKWYISDNELKAKNSTNVVPMIRLSEMYYIAAESYARDNNFVKAKELLMKVRSERGCTADITISNWDDFQKELLIDARREWISEGQLLYLLKRLNAPISINEDSNPLTKKQGNLPIPANQSL